MKRVIESKPLHLRLLSKQLVAIVKKLVKIRKQLWPWSSHPFQLISCIMIPANSTFNLLVIYMQALFLDFYLQENL